MSLEAAIIENTAAIRDLIAGFAKSGLLTHGQVTAPAVSAATTPTAQPEKPKEEAKAITVQECINLVPGLVAKIGKENVIALCTEFGVAKASALKPEQAAAFHAKASALLA